MGLVGKNALTKRAGRTMSKRREALPPNVNTNASPPGATIPAPARRPSPLDALVRRTRPIKRMTATIARSTNMPKAKNR
jgi:hypothetical protein